MDRNIYSESSKQILALAHEHGYQVSTTQLARWHRAGLLPRPKQQPMGKARGTQSLYPHGTGTQLLLLCKLHIHERRLTHLVWQIWWEGYPVELQCIRDTLQQAALRLSERIHWFVTVKQLEQANDQRTIEWIDEHDFIEQFATIGLDTLLRRVRKRLGKDHFLTFMHMLIDIASGTFQGYNTAYDRREVMMELRILAKGLGLDELFLKDDANITHYIEKLVVPLLQGLSPWLLTLPWEQALKTAHNFDLLQARDALRMRLSLFEHAKDEETTPYIKMSDYPNWGDESQALFALSTMEEQAMLLVFWLALQSVL